MEKKKKVSRCDDENGFSFKTFVKRRSYNFRILHFLFRENETGASIKLLRRQAQQEKKKKQKKKPNELLNHRDKNNIPRNPFSVN